jgi:hypothetical protein
MTVQSNPINGSITITTIKFKRLITRTFYDYTIDEALEEFKKYFKSLKK